MRRLGTTLAVLVALAPASLPAAAGPEDGPRARLATALAGSDDPWVSYYGGRRVSELQRFALVDIDAERGAGNYSAEQIASMRSAGAIVVSYLNVGAAETFRGYWDRVERFVVEPYDGWPGEFWMRVDRRAFRRILLRRVAPQLVRAGVDGFYLDNLDIVQERFATGATRRGVIRLIAALRARYPDLVIVAQNGLDVLSRRMADGRLVHELVDAVAKEDVSSTFAGGRYRKVPVGRSDRTLDELAALADAGLPILTLDYAKTRRLAAYATARSRDRGFFPYVCVIDLDRVCDLG